MAKKTRKASRRASSASRRRGGTPKCDCPSTQARKAFKAASSCSAKSRAFDEIKRLAAKDEATLKPGQRALLFRDLLRKQEQVQNVCAREEASDSARFNGLGSYRRRARRRRRRR